MASVNKAIIVGNLGKDPEVRFTQSGQAMARFSVATTDTWMDRENGRQERTEWHNIVVWGKQAETCGQYLSKGRQVYIEGRIQTRAATRIRKGRNAVFHEINVAATRTIPRQPCGGGTRSGQSSDDEPGGGFDDAGAGSVPPDDDVPF